ncbi:unnamed protein product [Victoria cruziana]
MGDQRPQVGHLPQHEEPPRRLLREFFVPTDYDRASGMGPLVGPNQYEINASTINMLPSFYGLASEDPY